MEKQSVLLGKVRRQGLRTELKYSQLSLSIISAFSLMLLLISGCVQTKLKGDFGNHDCSLHLIGSSIVLYQRGVKGASGIHVYCNDDLTSKAVVKEYKVVLIRKGTPIKEVPNIGEVFNREVWKLIKSDAQEKDVIRFENVIAFRGREELRFSEFFFEVE